MARYIGQSMRCTQSSMELVSTVIGFDIVELWSENEDRNLHCTYVHANESLLQRYPDIIVGHYPNHKKQHKLSPRLCELARSSSERYHWRVVEKDGSNHGASPTPTPARLHPEFTVPIKTDMAFHLESEDTSGMSVFIVGFALDRIEFSHKKLKFLTGIGLAIFVAAFDLDDEEDDPNETDQHRLISAAELDVKEFMPRPLSSMSVAGSAGSSHGLALGVWAQHVEELSLVSTHSQTGRKIVGAALEASGSYEKLTGLAASASSSALPSSTSLDGESIFFDQQLAGSPEPTSHISAPQTPVQTPIPTTLSLPPTWDPVDVFAFPVAELSVSCPVPDNLLMEHFTELQHITDGSNANIFLARFGSERVIIKMIKEEVQLDQVAVHEFDVEHGMLSRISHPNIIKLKGAGRIPRRFIVLEYLGGGSLSNILALNQAKPGLAQKLFRRPTFTYATLLSRARDMADALHFLHEECHPGATIIHRDLKPDNVGFTASGQLKLFDFGLCTCVRQRHSKDEAYEMTGNTGSLRYMAPEVALRLPYNERADIYSFGIMVWQMARDRVPFKGMGREDFMSLVVLGGERPK